MTRSATPPPEKSHRPVAPGNKPAGGRPLLSAHRGGPEGRYAPNSIEAMAAAVEFGVDLVEFDVRTTLDGRFISYHDDSIDVEGQRRSILDLTAEEALTHAPEAARVEDILDLIKGRAVGHVDAKDTRLEVELVDLCVAVLGIDGFVFTTLEDVSVKRVRLARPGVSVALSLGRNPAGLSRLATLKLRFSEVYPARRVRDCDPTMLALNFKIARRGALRWAMRHELPVLLWTINDPELMWTVSRDTRYWAFTTDFPRLATDVAAGE